MRSFFFVFVIWAISTSAFGQRLGPAPEDQKLSVTHATDPRKVKRNPDTITGQCVVIPGGGNLIATPCTDTILTLVPVHPADSISVRTEHDGTFQFTIDHGQTYRIQPGSKYYEVVSPTDPISGGLNLQVQLRQK